MRHKVVLPGYQIVIFMLDLVSLSYIHSLYVIMVTWIYSNLSFPNEEISAPGDCNNNTIIRCCFLLLFIIILLYFIIFYYILELLLLLLLRCATTTNFRTVVMLDYFIVYLKTK